MEFNELKTKMEEMGFKFEWRDEDVEGTEEDEDTGKEHKVTVHAKGWTVNYPPAPGYWYPIFVPVDAPNPKAYLNVMLEKYEKRHDGDEAEARMMKHFKESFNARQAERRREL